MKSDLRNSGFGFAVFHQARKTGITGFMKYGDEGFPVIDAQGENQQVDRFIRWCREGRTNIEITISESPPGPQRDFRLIDSGSTP